MVNIPNYEKKESYSFGDVSFLDCILSRRTLGKALSVIDQKDFTFLSTYSPPPDKGFLWTPENEKPEQLKDIENRVGNSDGHSGSSFAWTMRALEAIAKEGWVAYYQKFIAE